MKFKNRKEQREVTETMNALLLPLMQYLNEETSTIVKKSLEILSTVEIENKENSDEM